MNWVAIRTSSFVLEIFLIISQIQIVIDLFLFGIVFEKIIFDALIVMFKLLT